MLSSLSLYSCRAKTYEEIYETYESYVSSSLDDYQALMTIYNEMTTTWIKTSFMINCVISTLDFYASGSGVVIASDDTHYYVLTNSHVIGGEHLIDYQHSISAIDINGTSYQATLVVADDDYDLAMIKFTKGLTVYPEIVFANKNPDHKINVVVLGHPDRQVNAMTIGYYLGMTTIDLDEQSVGSVTIPVLKLDAPVQAGSSGSLVINTDFQMIGIIFAGNFSNQSHETQYAYAIPIESVQAFLDQQALEVGDPS